MPTFRVKYISEMAGVGGGGADVMQATCVLMKILLVYQQGKKCCV